MSRLRPTDLSTPSMVHCAHQILRWARDYISQPDPRLGRGGAICPFVPAALKENTCYIAVHEEIDDRTTAEQLEELLADYVEVFLRTPPSTGPKRLVKTIIIAFPNMSARRALILDEIHARMKSSFVEKGMMLGQFHPRYAATAVRNPSFENKRCPVPILALRHIARHDILFLNGRQDWFEHYRSRYGAQYETGADSDEHGFAKLYRDALRRFTPATPDPRECRVDPLAARGDER